MKKLKSFFIITTMLLLYTNNSYASTTDIYTTKEGSGIIKFLFLVFAFALVAAVLYLSYKFDKKDAIQKRKAKIEKYKTKEKMQQVYDEKKLEKNIINSYNSKVKEVKPNQIAKKIVSEEVENDDDIKIKENIIKKYNDNIIEKDIKVSAEDKKKIFNLEENDVEEKLLKHMRQDVSHVQIPEEVEVPQKVIIPEEINGEEENIILSNTTNDSTMVINTNDIKKMTQEENNKQNEYLENDYLAEADDEDEDEEEELYYENEELSKIGKMFEGKVKGYDYDEDDFELADLKETIAAANIKKYKKVGETVKPIVVTNKNDIRKNSMLIENKKAKKRYTRKKEQIQEEIEPITPTKKYTRKKKKEVKEQKEENKEIKSKRGRKPKVKDIDKVEEKTKSKRGRKPSNKK